MDIGQIIGSIVPFAESLPVLRAILGLVLVFFVPGFAWTLVFFNRVNVVERIALSFGLSIAIVTLSVIVLNRLVGIRITGFNSLLIIMVITVVALGIYSLKRFIIRRQGKK
jgi:uncharacterized membrane protein